ncbi:type VI secretion system baseplate subunit TssK [Candidatus Venteria ishoeyi]|uniref:Type VI secretion system baseplate subunit TssK n=1 Tax=Candidatus Venteria ishoeyi TaxID=1899563 RepID=A0A1H6FDG8_9GAMM|nr:type VI secretion system baseplate subunit TssK [Candidatus Venteria ishoeyi]MDM8546462.1 type VI secretion system baseplate subunit TssK [Candidatus Venteria ishoeyi]SEH08087.1 Uncharacterised protein [Candidatus Venteria ishoeyi]
MKEVYELSDAIQWHEGMLLAPQHFQQMSLRFDQLLHYHMMVSIPFFWGIRHLRIDPVLLLNGRFSIMELEGIFPDGLVAWHWASDGELELDLEAILEDLKRGNQKVYLIVPARRPDMNVFQGDMARYLSMEGKTILDDNTGEGELRIPRLKPHLKLYIGTEPPPKKYTSMPLAEVAYKNEAFALTDFIPPTLNVLPASPLYEMSLHIATRVREKAAFLSERLRLPSYSSRLEKPMLFETQNIIQGLVTALPQLEAILYAKTGHPYNLYQALCALSGSMAGFAGAQLPPVFPAYQQNDLKASFTPVLNFINKILDSIHESYIAVAFHLEADNRFTLRPDEAWLGQYFIVGMRGQQGVGDAELVQWMSSAVIGSSDQVQELQETRVLGATRKPIDKDDEMELIASKGLVLFRVETDHRLITPGEVLEVFNNTAAEQRFRPGELIFYAPNLT